MSGQYRKKPVVVEAYQFDNRMSTAAKFSGPVCRGSWSLGTACGKCERCKATCPTDTQAPDVVVMEADIVATADLFEAMHDKAAAWAVRSVGLCGTVHHATAEFLARHRLSTQSAMQARIEKMEAALRVGEKFLNACNSAWAASEPSHRVKAMLNLADEFRATLSNIGGSNDG